MTYNSDIHHRNSIRLQSYDYRAAGAYFVTICTFQKEPILAAIAGGEARLTALGEVVQECWNEIPQHFPNVKLDMFVAMPNHIHAIFMIHEPVGATHASPDVKTTDVVGARHASPDNGTTDKTRARHARATMRRPYTDNRDRRNDPSAQSSVPSNPPAPNRSTNCATPPASRSGSGTTTSGSSATTRS